MLRAWKHLTLLLLSVWGSTVPAFQVTRRCSSAPSRLFAQKKASSKRKALEGQCTITYSPNFNRHIVSYEVKNGPSTKKTAVRSFQWLDEALEAYPNATLKPMDPPPPFPSTKAPAEDILLLSRIIAGAGVNESSVYYLYSYLDDQATSEVIPGSPAMKNNGGSYLYRFLAKLYSVVPSITAAEIHREVMNKFPRIAFYDAALVHERLFFLLSPLPPSDVLGNLKRAAQANPTKRTKLVDDAAAENTDASAHFDDFPLLFYKYGYGAGLDKIQLAQALQSLPQYWLPIYLGDALASTKKPQDVLPYIFYHLNSNPNAFREATEDLDHLLTGTAWADVASLAHAKSSLKLTGDQCHVLLHAFPTLRTSDTEPNWEFFQHGPVRPMLIEESLAYLRIRLQLDPAQLFSLIKSQLELQSKELQQLVLRMPSLLGMSTSTLDDRLRFFLLDVGMTPEQLKKSVLKLPALLQYATSNLETKIKFFRGDLHIQEHSLIIKMLVAQPTIWGLSTEHKLKPFAAALENFCGLSSKEAGELISRAPELLNFNWKSNLEPKLLFLLDRLDLRPTELKSLVGSTPRILTYSLHGSLSVKIDMLEEHLSQNPALEMTIKDLLLQTPSLLITSKSRLIDRLSKSDTSGKKIRTRHNETIGGIASRRRKRGGVIELTVNGTVVKKFLSVKDAAADAGTSAPNMCSVLRQGRLFRGKKYIYGEQKTEKLSQMQAVVKEEQSGGDNHPSSTRPENDQGSLRVAVPESSSCDTHAETEETCLSAYVSGRVYPPNDASQARGTRRVGGMVVAMPSLSKSFSTLFQQALQDSYGEQLLSLKACQLDEDQDGLVGLIGYTNLEASRRRCSLYACFVALRVVTQLFALIGKASKAYRSQGIGREDSCPPTPTHIDIVTDSSYAFELLNGSDKLWEWGSSQTLEDFVYTGKRAKSYVNTDILYGLCRAYYKLVDPQGAVASALQTNITVNFVLDPGGTTPLAASEFRDKMDRWGKEAAVLFYRRCYPYQKISQS